MRVENAPREYLMTRPRMSPFSQKISGFLSYQYLQDFICVSGFLVGFSLISSRCFDMLTPDKSQ